MTDREDIRLLRVNDFIRNRHRQDGVFCVERFECGEPVITTRSGKIRIPASEYEAHWINVSRKGDITS